jgi:hypothetical protein
MTGTQLDVEHLFTMSLTTGNSRNSLIRSGPAGTRIIAEVTGGTFNGPRLSGTVIGPGGDWVHARSDRSMRLDVRLLLVTEDNESILMTYNGIGLPQDDGTTQLRTAPTFETGADAYQWINNIQAVGIGSTAAGVVDYEVYAVL